MQASIKCKIHVSVKAKFSNIAMSVSIVNFIWSNPSYLSSPLTSIVEIVPLCLCFRAPLFSILPTLCMVPLLHTVHAIVSLLLYVSPHEQYT